MSILLVGLDNSGKTTILNYMKPKKAPLETVPTVGYNVEEFQKNNIKFSAFDMSGQGKYRDLWNTYYNDAHAIVFVLDATDELRFGVAKEEIRLIIESSELQGKKLPILFFANKMDLPTAVAPMICMARLGLEEIKDFPWHIQPSSAINGTGVEEGLRWLIQTVNATTKKTVE